jgi:CheY-like chemotaxis protein
MKNCLVVDDSYDIYVIIQAGLSEHYHVDYAPDAFSAHQLLGHKHFDVVLCDIRMPHMDGVSFAEELKKKMISLPIIFISGSIEPDTVRRVFQVGGANLISKPIDMQELLEKTARAIEMRESQKVNEGGSQQELGYIYNLLKIHYYETQEILYQIQLYKVPTEVVLEELDKKQRLGRCHLDDPENIKFLGRAA